MISISYKQESFEVVLLKTIIIGKTIALKGVNMPITTESKEYIIKSIASLPPQKIQEVVDFIEFISSRPHIETSGIDTSSLLLQQDALSKIWEDEEDLYEL